MSASEITYCSACRDSDFTNAIVLCPLHAEAEAMRDVLARLVESTDRVFPDARGLFPAVEEARPILARIDGDTPDA